MELPSKGAVLSVEIGWERGAGVPIGMWKRGSFKVDSIEWEGPPDMISITAHSADLTAEFKKRRNATYHGATLGSVTDQIAKRAGLTARCHPDLASQVVDHAEQANQSDMEFLRDLARRYDAVATVKAGALILAPVEATTTATGAEIGIDHACSETWAIPIDSRSLLRTRNMRGRCMPDGVRRQIKEAHMLLLAILAATPSAAAQIDYGQPVTYEQGIKAGEKAIKADLIDPSSAQIEWPYNFVKFSEKVPLFKRTTGYATCVTVNSKNRLGGYVGSKAYRITIRDVAHAIASRER